MHFSFLRVSVVFRGLLFLLLGSFLLGCTERLPFEPTPIDYSYRSTLPLDVRQINVRDETSNPTTAPQVLHLFPVDLTAGLVQWGEDRLEAVGTQGVMNVTIKEVSAVEEQMSIDEGFVNRFFKREIELAYELQVLVLFESQTETGTVRAEVMLRSKQYLLEDALFGVPQMRRQQELWNLMALEVARDFDDRAEKVIEKDFQAIFAR